MIAGALALTLLLAQAPEEPPPVSAPPLISAPDGVPAVAPPQTPLQQSLEQPRASRAQSQFDPADRRGEEGEEPAPGTPTAWWKRSLASFGIAAGVGGTLAGLAALLSYEAVCGIGSGLCQGGDFFAIFAIAGMTATFAVPAAVSIVGRALGGRAKYGHALIGSGLFGAAALIVSLAMTGGTDVPIFVIPVFSTLMVLGAVGSFELFSFLKEPKVTAQPVVGLLPGGGMFGLRASF
jgi:hypothetical protein